jgi:hypothetical protein
VRTKRPGWISDDVTDGRSIGSVLDAEAASPLDASMVGDLYLNRRLGLAFRRPDGWTFEGATEAPHIEMGSAFDAKGGMGATALWRVRDDFPALVTLAAPRGDEGIAQGGSREPRPTITIYSEGLCSDDTAWINGEFSLHTFVEQDLPGIAASRGRFRLETRPRSTSLSGRHAVEYRASYAHYVEGSATPVRARERALYVAQCPEIFAVRMIDFPWQASNLAFVFDEFIASLSFA